MSSNAALASVLPDSVEEPAGGTWEEAWRREIDERLRDAEMDAGGADEPWTSVREELRASFR
jgi:hypothetical protein